MDVRMNPVDPVGPTIGEGMQTVSTNGVQASDRSFHCFSDTDGIDESNGRPSKKPKIEAKAVACVLPQGFLDPINHDERSQSILEHGGGDGNPKAVVPSMSKQFWKAGDYEGSPNNSESISHPAGMDHVRVHPRFLHSNATSHKWALGAFAELLDNSLDEVRTGATYVHVDVLNNERVTHNKMLLVKGISLLQELYFIASSIPFDFLEIARDDNGGGMTPETMRACMSLGYSVKSKLANTIGQYGNGFKTSTMRLGADVLVYTRCPGQDGRSSTQSIGMLSYTFLMETGKEDIVVPMFDFLNDQGTHIIIYNLWEDEEGQLELDFDTDLHIHLLGFICSGCLSHQLEKLVMGAVRTDISLHCYCNVLRTSCYNSVLTLSLQMLAHIVEHSYASILYLSIPNGFRIILRGEDVIHHKIVDDMMLSEKVMYKPTQPNAEGTRKDQNLMVAVVTIGFVKDAKDHIDVQGFNVYHKNRLIKPFWRVWNAAGSDGRGVIGVLEADFIEPAHDKQGFERTTVLSRLENRLVAIQKKYWSTNCQEIGYAKRCKSVSDTKCRPSMKDESDQYIAPLTGIDANDARVKLRPIRKLEASKPSECAQNDETPEAYACTSREKQCKASASLKESKASTRRLPTEVTTINGDGHASTNCNGDTIAKLREENFVLKQRLEGSERVMINNLLSDLQYERDKVVSLENQVLKAHQKIEELDREQISLIDIFSEERQRRDHQEETLRKRWKVRDGETKCIYSSLFNSSHSLSLYQLYISTMFVVGGHGDH
ncbi:hypothetical protein L6452_21371 [Arctium lappa]|uniref:Uncharacterized protein n=1 Tax=Arctium lappa TaxID=4217 RepID=A0ACB9BFW9_ARCLA|nr:hypothetical protein L6452_21371 [Arctium lappa]